MIRKCNPKRIFSIHLQRGRATIFVRGSNKAFINVPLSNSGQTSQFKANKLALRGPYFPLIWFTSHLQIKNSSFTGSTIKWKLRNMICHSSSLAGYRWVCPPRTAWTGRLPPTTLNQLWPTITIIINTPMSMEIVRYQNFIVQLLI